MRPRLRLLLHDIRRGRKLTFFALAGFGTLMIVTLGAVAVFYYSTGANKPAVASNDERIPVANYTVGVVDTFGCLSEGAACSGYDNAKDYISQLSPGEFVYTPIGEGDPGTTAEDGSKTVSLSKLDDKDLRAVGQAVIRDGGIAPGDIAVEQVTESSGRTGTYKVPSSTGRAAEVGSVSFNAGSDPGSVTLSSVLYVKGG